MISFFQKVVNKDKYPTAADTYYACEDDYGVKYLFTQSDLDTARLRAKKNPEDFPKINWVYRNMYLIIYFTGFFLGAILSSGLTMAIIAALWGIDNG